MNCPIDNNVLSITNRGNIEIDYCPQCRGVWLDRGELDKLIEQNNVNKSSYNDSHSNYAKPHHDSDYGYHKKKKSSFLEDIFDF